jgi:hypothetical protein
MSRISVSIATPDDLLYIVSLMRLNRESVGGLPVPALKERVDRGTVLIARINEDPVGYVLYDNRGGVIRIPQACIQYDARRRKYGIALMQSLLSMHSDAAEVSLRCAADLEANIFWRDMGFVCVGTSPGGKRRGRTINAWTLWLTPRLITAQDISCIPAAQMRQDSMYDDSGFLTKSPDGFSPVELLPKLAWANRK